MDELTNNNRIIEVTTQTRKRGRPQGTTRKEPGQTSSVHVPERVRDWMRNKNRMRLGDYVALACNWNDRMEELAEEVRLMKIDEDLLVEDRRKLRKEVERLTEENADLLRTKARTMERLSKGDVVFK
jgi:hypothetical protein